MDPYSIDVGILTIRGTRTFCAETDVSSNSEPLNSGARGIGQAPERRVPTALAHGGRMKRVDQRQPMFVVTNHDPRASSLPTSMTFVDNIPTEQRDSRLLCCIVAIAAQLGCVRILVPMNDRCEDVE
jgi:hypothetical protein